MTGRRTFVLVDGENVDATLGTAVLGRRPAPEERPRWERVTTWIEQRWETSATGLFFLNASSGQLPTSFVQALLAMSYRPVPLAGTADQKVVDLGILRTLEALREQDADVVLVSHDADFAAHLATLADGTRRVGVVGFREFTSTHLALPGVDFFDLEYDLEAFTSPLPRVRVIPLEEFDPLEFLR